RKTPGRWTRLYTSRDHRHTRSQTGTVRDVSDPDRRGRRGVSARPRVGLVRGDGETRRRRPFEGGSRGPRLPTRTRPRRTRRNRLRRHRTPRRELAVEPHRGRLLRGGSGRRPRSSGRTRYHGDFGRDLQRDHLRGRTAEFGNTRWDEWANSHHQRLLEGVLDDRVAARLSRRTGDTRFTGRKGPVTFGVVGDQLRPARRH